MRVSPALHRYLDTYPITLKIEDFAKYQKRSDADYNLRTEGKTLAEKEAALKLIKDWCNTLDRTLFDSSSLKSLNARVEAIVNKFSGLVSVHVALEA